jgi:hypothetical protein
MTFKNTYKDDEDKLAQDAAAPFRAQQSDGFDDSVYRESKPVYDDPYGERIGNLLDGLENREPFTYDPESEKSSLLAVGLTDAVQAQTVFEYAKIEDRRLYELRMEELYGKRNGQ